MELLVAIVLVVAIGAGAFSLFWQIAATRERLEQQLVRRSGTEALTRELERAVAVCYAGGREGVFVGGVEKVDIPCRVVRLGFGRGAARAMSGQVLRIEFDAAVGEVLGSCGDESPSAMIRGVEQFRLRYYDRGNWSESFDAAAAGRLPSAVEVSLWWLEEEEGGTGTGRDVAPEASSIARDTAEEAPSRPADVQLVVAIPDSRDEGGGVE